MSNSSGQPEAPKVARDHQIEDDVFGELAPLVAGKSEPELLALADRMEAFIGRIRCKSSGIAK
ncbi:MAG: hypothetical protein EpisKO_06060 [Epibacterium sp.]